MCHASVSEIRIPAILYIRIYISFAVYDCLHCTLYNAFCSQIAVETWHTVRYYGRIIKCTCSVYSQYGNTKRGITLSVSVGISEVSHLRTNYFPQNAHQLISINQQDTTITYPMKINLIQISFGRSNHRPSHPNDHNKPPGRENFSPSNWSSYVVNDLETESIYWFICCMPHVFAQHY